MLKIVGFGSGSKENMTLEAVRIRNLWWDFGLMWNY